MQVCPCTLTRGTKNLKTCCEKGESQRQRRGEREEAGSCRRVAAVGPRRLFPSGLPHRPKTVVKVLSHPRVSLALLPAPRDEKAATPSPGPPERLPPDRRAPKERENSAAVCRRFQASGQWTYRELGWVRGEEKFAQRNRPESGPLGPSPPRVRSRLHHTRIVGAPFPHKGRGEGREGSKG